jgi:hypothetical protein
MSKETREILTNADIAINSFIKKWCGDNAPHLLDSDDNDGERLRKTVDRLIAEKVAEGELKALNFARQASTSDVDIINRINELGYELSQRAKLYKEMEGDGDAEKSTS